jgi:predicted nucleic acid-binding protein
VASLPFVKTTAPADELPVKGLMTRMRPGEADCLTSAIEHPGSMLLKDALGAHEMATSRSLIYTGTLSCMVAVKKLGLIPELEPMLQELRTKVLF